MGLHSKRPQSAGGSRGGRERWPGKIELGVTLGWALAPVGLHVP